MLYLIAMLANEVVEVVCLLFMLIMNNKQLL